MVDTPLEEGQFEFGGVVFGQGCPVEVVDPDWSGPEITTADTALPGRDGTVFGRDTHGGTIIGFDLMANGDTAADGLAAWTALASAWTNPVWREQPRSVAPLRMRVWGGAARTVFGRPRAWDPATTKDIRSGITKHLADFATADGTFYGPEQSRTLHLAPDFSGGFELPLELPLQLDPVTTSDSHTITNTGDRSAWPVVTFAGPITNPTLTLLSTGARFRVLTSISHTQTLTIDPRPWAQTVLRSDGRTCAAWRHRSPCLGWRCRSGLRSCNSPARTPPGQPRAPSRGGPLTPPQEAHHDAAHRVRDRRRPLLRASAAHDAKSGVAGV